MVMRHVVRIHNAIADSEDNMAKGPVRSNYSDDGARDGQYQDCDQHPGAEVHCPNPKFTALVW